MKIQFKAAFLIIFIGVVIVCLLSVGYKKLNYNIVVEKELNNIENISKEAALHLDSHLKEKAVIATVITSSPSIKSGIMESNFEFAALSDRERKDEIEERNNRWKNTSDINDPFIQSHMNNPIAEYLKLQQVIRPGEYGEIFLTNRYGVMIATTGKLTTLSHAHKYWWQAAYNSGQGRIFLDDRGFDKSVEGYVLGVVVPLKDENEIIGILKCNVNIMGPMTDLVQEFSLRHKGIMKIVRTGGLIVSEHGRVPLSARVNENIAELLKLKTTGSAVVAGKNNNKLIAFASVKMTMGSVQIGFGGSKESIDHIKGNTGESWHIVVSTDEREATAISRKITRLILAEGFIITILIAAAALFFARWLSRPIVDLSATARSLGEGNLDARSDISTKDEVGFLAEALNSMAKNLQNTMTSRDQLAAEVKQRKKAEAEKELIISELEHALAEIKTLKGIVPICMHCKQIRDDKGYWNQLEKFISEHSEAQFSHGICENCLVKHYPEEIH